MKPPSDSTPCQPHCPVQRTAQVLDGKWTILVLRDLLSGSKRYSELQRSLHGISPRLLVIRLKALEAEGIVTRRAYPTVPPTTEYSLTPLGRQLMPVVQAMAQFGEGLLKRTRVAQRTSAAAPASTSVTRVTQGKKVAMPAASRR